MSCPDSDFALVLKVTVTNTGNVCNVRSFVVFVFRIISFRFVVAICDLVHDVEIIYGL